MVLINISDYTAESGKDLDMAFDLNMKISVSLCCYIFSILKSLYEDDSFLEMSALRFYKKKKKSIVGEITQALHFIEMYGHVGER